MAGQAIIRTQETCPSTVRIVAIDALDANGIICAIVAVQWAKYAIVGSWIQVEADVATCAPHVIGLLTSDVTVGLANCTQPSTQQHRIEPEPNIALNARHSVRQTRVTVGV